MKIEIREMGSVTVLSPKSAIAQDDVTDFVHVLEEQQQKTNGRMVLDFGNVAFLDSCGVEAVWDFSDQQQQSGQTAKLAAVPELCREILELTGIGEQLDIYDSCESAVRSYV